MIKTIKMNSRLPQEFYLQDDPVTIAKTLLGKVLHTYTDGQLTAGRIVETEAYMGAIDRASHAYPGKRTDRNAVMFRQGGVAYVYLIYGMYHLFNVVTSREGLADAVLVRALEPCEGIDIMMTRTGKQTTHRITSGPGLLSRAMGIDMRLYGSSLSGDCVWIEDHPSPSDSEIVETKRIGVEYAGPDSDLPWRFYIHGNPWISKK